MSEILRHLFRPERKPFEITGGASSVPKDYPNQDAYFLLNGAAGIADGVSQSEDGHIAAQTAMVIFERQIAQLQKKTPSLQKTRAILQQTAQEAHEVLERDPRHLLTTATVTFLWKNRFHIFVNVGDTRGYLLREDEKLEQITSDDDIIKTLFGDTEQTRELQAKMARVEKKEELSDTPIPLNNSSIILGESGDPKVTDTVTERELFFNRFIITNTLGAEFTRATISIVRALPGDRRLLTGDGVTDNHTFQVIETLLREYPDPQDAANALVYSALEKSVESRTNDNIRPKVDDITAVVEDFR